MFLTSLKNFPQQLVESSEFDLFFDVWLDINNLEALGMLDTPIWFSPNSNHTCGL